MRDAPSASDTIAAVSTPAGRAGIGIVRISGPRALKIASLVFRPKNPHHLLKSHRLLLGELVDPETDTPVDEILLTFMKAPNSYTREDVIEINSHSGYALLDKILEIVLRAGARHAQPGEFTFRAFMNGRIDLTQAEAVMDLIRATSERGVVLACRQLQGRMKERLASLKNNLVEVLSLIEVDIDYPDEGYGLASGGKTAKRLLTEVVDLLERIQRTYEERRFWVDGFKVVIVGRVNAGKSSILNRLLEEQRAIVSSIPGTTRDVIETMLHLKGIPVRLLDTAGYRNPTDEVEKTGLNLAEKNLDEADLALLVLDRSQKLDEDDLKILHRCQGINTLVVLNKIDLPNGMGDEAVGYFPDEKPCVSVSALTGEGFQGLLDAIHKAAVSSEGSRADTEFLPNARQYTATGEALGHVNEALKNLENNAPLEIIAEDLHLGMDAVSSISGEGVRDEVLHRIFEKFCLGK